MKKVLVLTLTLLTALSLTTMAHADVIVSPVAAAGDTVLQYLPWVLVGAVVGVVVFLVQKYWKKKK